MTEPRYGGQTEAWWWVQSDINTVLIDSTDQWTDITRPLNGIMIDGEGRMYACKFPIYCSIARVYKTAVASTVLRWPSTSLYSMLFNYLKKNMINTFQNIDCNICVFSVCFSMYALHNVCFPLKYISSLCVSYFSSMIYVHSWGK